MELSVLDITSAKEKQFNSRKIYTVEDLQKFFPARYRNYDRVSDAKSIFTPGLYLIHGRVTDKRAFNGRVCRAEVLSDDNTKFSVAWFYNSYEQKKLEIGEEYYFGGPVDFYQNKISMSTPEILTQVKSEAIRVLPKYPVIKGMSAEYLKSKVKKAIENIEDTPEKDKLAESISLISRKDALKEMHQPSVIANLKAAKRRIACDDLFDFFSELKQKETVTEHSIMKITELTRTMAFTKSLSFKLTDTQKSALSEIKSDFLAGRRLNSLLLGDVGSGKTIVAIITAMMAAENGYQAAILSPTQILAKQTFEETKARLEPWGIKVGYIHGKLKASERKAIQKALLEEKIDILVGTHAIISDGLEFSNLGLLIIDEEHRFGVAQKEALKQKSKDGIDQLSMSATPIPRSLALTLYGQSTKVLTIAVPPGRKPITTERSEQLSDIYPKILSEIKAGHQCYVVCPLISESDVEAMAEVSSAEQIHDELSSEFSKFGINVGVITGAMKSEEINATIVDFADNKIQILVATTIVEVGVNIPNSTIMIVKNAERFGLAQLHQLRGRVGRSDLQSYCYLVSDKETERLDVMCRTNDGFEIAEEDLRFRGAGKLTGEKQSGYSKEVDLVMRYPNLSLRVKNWVYQGGVSV